MSWSTSELRVRLSPPVKYFTDRSKAVFLLWIFSFMFLFCLVFAMSLCASVYMCFVVTCWERADLLALVCGVFCEFVTFPSVSWVRCGTWLYRFLIFAPLLTLNSRLLPRTHHNTLKLSDQKMQSFICTLRTFAILDVSLTPITAPISSNLGMLVAVVGATRVFAAIMLLEIKPSS